MKKMKLSELKALIAEEIGDLLNEYEIVKGPDGKYYDDEGNVVSGDKGRRWQHSWDSRHDDDDYVPQHSYKRQKSSTGSTGTK